MKESTYSGQGGIKSMVREPLCNTTNWIGLSLIFAGLFAVCVGLGIYLSQFTVDDSWKFYFVVGSAVTFSGYVLRVVNEVA